MNINEVIAFGKHFKRPEDKHWFKGIDDDYYMNWGTIVLRPVLTFEPCPEDDDCDICFNSSDRVTTRDILREDWEVDDRPTYPLRPHVQFICKKMGRNLA